MVRAAITNPSLNCRRPVINREACRPSLLEMLRRRGKVRLEDLSRLRLTQPMDVIALKVEWLASLDEAERFVVTRPPAELGCL